MVTSKKSAAKAPTNKGRAAAPRKTPVVASKAPVPDAKKKTVAVSQLIKSAKTATKALVKKVVAAKNAAVNSASAPAKTKAPIKVTPSTPTPAKTPVKKPPLKAVASAKVSRTPTTKSQPVQVVSKQKAGATAKAKSIAPVAPKSPSPSKSVKAIPLKATSVTKNTVPKTAVKRSPSPMQEIKTTPLKRTVPTPPVSAPAPGKTSLTGSDAPKPRSSRSRGPESSPAPIVLASNAAKASFGAFQPAVQPMQPAPAIAKKDPKLANNWKNKPLEELSDADIVAMPDSEYMNAIQMAYFRKKLLALKVEILESANETTEHLRDDSSVVPDPTDRATIEEEHALELRTRDRERKLLKKIEQSLARIDAGDYGYCDETGEPIGTGRLLARPTATLSLEAQQRRELKQKLFGD